MENNKMTPETIVCPKCGEVIQISQAISQNIEAEIEQKYKEQLVEWKNKERDAIKTQTMQEVQAISNKQIELLKKELKEKENDMLVKKLFKIK